MPSLQRDFRARLLRTRIDQTLQNQINQEMQKIVSSTLPQALVKSTLELWNAQQRDGLNPSVEASAKEREAVTENIGLRQQSLSS
ncbi:hypothetical protein AABC73_13910 [Pseudomonas sp. G.S.17]|uniref:hypothetical protein n=1 Tax=Pseudomonas sp. G.S.17 TaxID=3137451 RepID=UPI00311CCCE8